MSGTLREGDPCLARDADICTRGIINAVYPGGYFRIRFPLGSPYVDDWAVFRAHEITTAPPAPKAAAAEKYKENYPSDKII